MIKKHSGLSLLLASGSTATSRTTSPNESFSRALDLHVEIPTPPPENFERAPYLPGKLTAANLIDAALEYALLDQTVADNAGLLAHSMRSSLRLLAAEEDGEVMDELPPFSESAEIGTVGINDFLVMDTSSVPQRALMHIQLEERLPPPPPPPQQSAIAFRHQSPPVSSSPPPPPPPLFQLYRTEKRSALDIAREKYAAEAEQEAVFTLGCSSSSTDDNDVFVHSVASTTSPVALVTSGVSASSIITSSCIVPPIELPAAADLVTAPLVEVCMVGAMDDASPRMLSARSRQNSSMSFPMSRDDSEQSKHSSSSDQSEWPSPRLKIKTAPCSSSAAWSDDSQFTAVVERFAHNEQQKRQQQATAERKEVGPAIEQGHVGDNESMVNSAAVNKNSGKSGQEEMSDDCQETLYMRCRLLRPQSRSKSTDGFGIVQSDDEFWFSWGSYQSVHLVITAMIKRCSAASAAAAAVVAAKRTPTNQTPTNGCRACAAAAAVNLLLQDRTAGAAKKNPTFGLPANSIITKVENGEWSNSDDEETHSHAPRKNAHNHNLLSSNSDSPKSIKHKSTPPIPIRSPPMLIKRTIGVGGVTCTAAQLELSAPEEDSTSHIDDITIRMPNTTSGYGGSTMLAAKGGGRLNRQRRMSFTSDDTVDTNIGNLNQKSCHDQMEHTCKADVGHCGLARKQRSTLDSADVYSTNVLETAAAPVLQYTAANNVRGIASCNNNKARRSYTVDEARAQPQSRCQPPFSPKGYLSSVSDVDRSGDSCDEEDSRDRSGSSPTAAFSMMYINRHTSCVTATIYSPSAKETIIGRGHFDLLKSSPAGLRRSTSRDSHSG